MTAVSSGMRVPVVAGVGGGVGTTTVAVDVEDAKLELNWEDEVIKGACITRDGEIVHEGARKAAA